MRPGESLFRSHRMKALVLLAASCSPQAFGSNGIELTGVSFKARARGGADVAVGDSALAQIDNPATLALTPFGRARFDLTGQLVFSDASWHNPLGSYRSEAWLAPIGDAALALPISSRFTWGLALHDKSGFGSRFYARHLLIPFQKRRIESDAKNFAFHISGAYKLTDRISIGGGIRAEWVTAEFSAVFGPADLEFERGHSYGIGFQLGAHCQATDALALGIAYRSPTWASDLRGGNARVSLFGVLPMSLGEGRIDNVGLPQRVSVGAAWDVADWFKLVGEARWLGYSSSTWNRAAVATSGVLDLRVPLRLGYRDQWILILGAEFKVNEHWTLGLGYNYGRNPVTPLSLLPIASVVAEHHLSAGFRYEVGNWWVGCGYVIGFANSMRTHGFSDIPLGIDYALSEVTQTQHSMIIGFGFAL